MFQILKNIKELIRGMCITGKHLGMHAVTLQYPEEKMEMFERSRGIVVLLSDKETGELNCTSCELCMRACPTAAIIIVAPRGEDKKKVLKQFDVDNALCCFCGLCEEACNFSALKMATMYEFATMDKNDLYWDMNKLQEMGRDVPYEDTRKKRKPKKVKPALPTPDEAKTESVDKTVDVNKDEVKEGTPPPPKPDDAKAEQAMPDSPKTDSVDKTADVNKEEIKEATSQPTKEVKEQAPPVDEVKESGTPPAEVIKEATPAEKDQAKPDEEEDK